MSVPAPRQPRNKSTRWEVIRYAIGSNAKTARLCVIWLVMTGAPGTVLAELLRHIRLRICGLSFIVRAGRIIAGAIEDASDARLTALLPARRHGHGRPGQLCLHGGAGSLPCFSPAWLRRRDAHTGETGAVHDIIGDILDWDEAHKAYVAGEGRTGERYKQRLEAADQMAEIEARWEHLPGGFHSERNRIKLHIRAVAAAAPSMSSEELCWLAIAAASAWIPVRSWSGTRYDRDMDTALEVDARLFVWARSLAMSLPPMPDAEIHHAAKILARIDARRSLNLDSRRDVGPAGRVGGSYDDLPALQRIV
jgi:hypothetical protein